jgi:hypothetical protein
MASDHFIQCCAMINCLLLCGIVLFFVVKGKMTSGNDDDPE